jgi:putative photosynthetic complex assembly protein 2
MSYALPLLFAVFIWWFSTGLVILLDNLPRTTFRWSLLISTLLGLASLVGLAHTADQATVAGAYCAFTCALLLWGWHELSFLTGWVTGPRRRAASPNARGVQRLVQAVQAIVWHELAIAISAGLVVAITWREPNQIGAWTFGVLWVMRLSAKFNVFLGVRNLSIELLPDHLKYLASYFRARPMNLLFPWSIAAGSAAAVIALREAMLAPADSAASIGALLVGALIVLAVIEHWLLVLPVQATALWRWALRRQPPAAPVSDAPLVIERDDALLHVR